MKTFILIFVHLACALVLAIGSCSHAGSNAKLKGDWHTKDGSTKLKITADKFTEDNGLPNPVTEDYIIKADTIFTSFDGSQPSKFVIQKVDAHNLTLLYPDSVSVAFIR